MSPLRLANTATGGNGFAFAPKSGGNTFAASALMLGQRTVLNARLAVNFALCGSFPDFAKPSKCFAPASKFAKPFTASLRTFTCSLALVTNGASSGMTFWLLLFPNARATAAACLASLPVSKAATAFFPSPANTIPIASTPAGSLGCFTATASKSASRSGTWNFLINATERGSPRTASSTWLSRSLSAGLEFTKAGSNRPNASINVFTCASGNGSAADRLPTKNKMTMNSFTRAL